MEARKTKPIRKKAKEPIEEKLSQADSEPYEEIHSNHLEAEGFNRCITEALKQIEELPCELKQICGLPEEKKKQLMASRPRIAKYFYSKPRERAKFFHELNFKYRKAIKPSKPPGSAPKKKTIKFKKRFQVRRFDQSETPKSVTKQKAFSQKQIRNVHFT